MFASHAWGVEQPNHKHVALLVRELERIGLSVWFDDERLSGEIHRKISEGLRDSFIYLACISQDFLEKIEDASSNDGVDWCDFEFTASIDSHGKRRSVCVVCEPELLSPTTWFGPVRTALSGLLYADYSSASKLEAAALRIKREVEAKMRID